MKKIFIVLAAVSFMVITGCGGGGNSDSTPAPAASQTTASVTDTASSSVSGSLDTTFGTGGIVTTPIGSYDAYAYALGIQSDGRILAAGYSSNGSNYDFALVRYNTNGSLDTTFGTGGTVTTPIGSGNAIANALGIQSDGNIVATGSSYNGSNYDITLVRYKTNGSLDTTFGTGGIVTTPIGSYDAYAYALAIQSDGRIVVSGYSSNGSNYDFALVRYNTDGSLDTTFGTGGIVITPMGSGYDIAYALAIQSDGRILAAGNSYNGSNYNFALVRYNTNGSLDTTFGTGGIVTTPIGTGDSEALALGIQSNGNILAAGKSFNGSHYDFTLVRYSTNGSLDTTFGTSGIVTTPIGNYDSYAIALGIQSDGNILAAGKSPDGSNNDFALVRYNTNGSLDTTFGTGGIVTTPVGNGADYANALVIQSDGNILAAGKSLNGSHYDFTLVRYNTNGSLDTTFGTGGIVTTPIGSYDSYAIAFGIQSDGNILAAGSSDNGSNINFALVSYLP
ncbi:MAG: delta-60 repeat domain-containing protein [Smithella sp.]